MNSTPLPRRTDTPLRVVFIVSKFPCYDEAFILRELEEFSKRLDLRIFSLRGSNEKIVHDAAAALLPKTVYVPYFFSFKVLGAMLRMKLLHPVRYFRALAQLIAGNFKNPEFLLKGLAFFPKAVWLADWVLKEKVDLIHAYWATYPASVALAASTISGVPFSFTGHAHDIYLSTAHLPEKIRAAKFVTTCTSSNQEYLRKLVPQEPADKIFLNYHGLDLSRFETPGKKRGDVFEILSVGTLQAHKGFNYLLPALALLSEKGLKFRCTIIGGGVLEGELRAQLKSLKLDDKVVMTGALKQAQVLPYYKKADLKILMAQPEWHWGIPNVLIEALAAQAAVVTTAFGSVEELIQDGITGFIVPPTDSEKLAQRIEKLYHDEALRLRLMEAGRRFVIENFDLSKKMDEFMRRMEQAVG